MKAIKEQYHFKEGQNLLEFNPSDTSCFPIGRTQAEEELFVLRAEFDDLQELLYAQGKYRILIVLQGMDTAGKDGLIRGVFRGVNPKGVKVVNFKAPSAEELNHDYLWRIHQNTPSKGEIVIFNRSHYEDVLAVRVHNYVPKKVWKRRYKHINDFEEMLVDEGTIVLKFFLHISKDEQKKRLRNRLKSPEKSWKVSEGDFKERQLWDKYQEAFNVVFQKTSTEKAPWYVIPSNNKWYRNLVVASILLTTIKGLNIELPKTDPKLIKRTVK